MVEFTDGFTPVPVSGLWPFLHDVNTWRSRIQLISQDGPALGNSVVATSLLTAASKIVVPASVFQVGNVFRIEATGRVSNIITTPGTLTLDIRFVSSAGTVIVANGGAMSLNIVAKTNVPWYLYWLFTVRAAGITANLMHQGGWVSESVVGSPLPTVGSAGEALLPNAAPVVGSNFNSSLDQTLDLFGTWSIANAGNTLQVHQLIVEPVFT